MENDKIIRSKKNIFQSIMLFCIAINLFTSSMSSATTGDPSGSDAPTERKSGLDSRWEFWTGSIVGVTRTNNNRTISGGFLGDRAEISPSIGYLLADYIEIYLVPRFNFHTSGNFLGRFMVGIGSNFFGKTIGDAFFAKGLVGFDDFLDNRTSDEVHFTLGIFAWSIFVGKRFAMNPYVSFSPEVGLTVIHEKRSTITAVSIVPLQFSLFF